MARLSPSLNPNHALAMSAFDAIKKGRSSIFKLPRKCLVLRDGADKSHNPRTDFGDIPALAQLIARHGIINPLRGTMNGKHLLVGHGERRLKAYDYAIEHKLFDPKKEPQKALIPVQPENFRAESSDLDRLIHHVVLNEAKPLDMFEKGRTIQRMMSEYGLDEEKVSGDLGFSITHVRDCLKLVNEAAPGLQDAVAAGKLAPTTAIDIVREEPNQQRQEEIVQEGAQKAEEAGSDRISAKHLPIAVGKKAQAARRKSADPFEGKDSTPDGPTSNHQGEYTAGIEEMQLKFTGHKSVHAYVLLALVGSTFHVGYRLKWPGKTKDDGFLQVWPSVNGITADTKFAAILRALQQIRSEYEVKDFKGKPEILESLDDRIVDAAAGAEVQFAHSVVGKSTPAAAPAAPPVNNPVIRDPVADLKEVIGAVAAKDAEKDRLKTAKKVLAFLLHKEDAKDLTKFILGIDPK